MSVKVSTETYASDYLCKMVKAFPAEVAKLYVMRSLETYREVFGEAATGRIRAAALQQYRDTHGKKKR